MTILETLTAAADQLQSVSDSPSLDATILLAAVFGVDRIWLLSHPERILTSAEHDAFQGLFKRRLAGWPIAYCTGWANFRQLRLTVTPDVLIPRPFTEHLVEAACDRIGQRAWQVADIGTGSGCIAIAITEVCPNVHVIATDISTAALSVAQKNIRMYDLENRITLAEGSLLEPFQVPADLIIANLPYLTPAQRQHPSLRHEPSEALIGADNGYGHLQSLFKELVGKKPQHGVLIELDPTQVERATAQLRETFPNWKIQTITDGRDIRGLGAWSPAST